MKDRLLVLEGLLKSGISPILLEDIPSHIFDESVVIESDCSVELLNGHYEGVEFMPPEWYTKLVNENSEFQPVLIINNINKIPYEEQIKFTEILKYKKVSTFLLPKDTIIIVTASNLKDNKINEDIYSLMAHV